MLDPSGENAINKTSYKTPNNFIFVGISHLKNSQNEIKKTKELKFYW
jgi:hypothetical protein